MARPPEDPATALLPWVDENAMAPLSRNLRIVSWPASRQAATKRTGPEAGDIHKPDRLDHEARELVLKHAGREDRAARGRKAPSWRYRNCISSGDHKGQCPKSIRPSGRDPLVTLCEEIFLDVTRRDGSGSGISLRAVWPAFAESSPDQAPFREAPSGACGLLWESAGNTACRAEVARSKTLGPHPTGRS